MDFQSLNSLFLSQALIIIACHDVSSPLQLIETTILEDIISVFVTSAMLKVFQGMVLSLHLVTIVV